MNLLAVEILLAALALKRGRRVAPFLLVALPLVVEANQATLGGVLVPWIRDYFDPAATACALAHASALLGLVVACWAGPEALLGGALARAGRRPTGSLYQI